MTDQRAWNDHTTDTAPASTDTVLKDDGSVTKKSTISNLSKAIVAENIALVASTTNNVSTTKHGFMPALDNDATHFFNGQGAQVVTPYTLLCGCSNVSPADGSVYYFGLPLNVSAITTAARKKVFIPRGGTVSRVDIAVYNNGGTQGTNENSTLAFRLNNSTDTTLSSAIQCNTADGLTNNYNITGLSIAVAAGDYFEIKWTCPTWVTNPTNVIMVAQVYIS